VVGSHLWDPRKPFQAACQRAGIKDLRIDDPGRVTQPLTPNSEKPVKRNGGDDGARTRDLRRDRKNVFVTSRLYLLFFQPLGNPREAAILLCYSRCFSWLNSDFTVDELYGLLA
jgi:hypothetical protein